MNEFIDELEQYKDKDISNVVIEYISLNIPKQKLDISIYIEYYEEDSVDSITVRGELDVYKTNIDLFYINCIIQDLQDSISTLDLDNIIDILQTEFYIK